MASPLGARTRAAFEGLAGWVAGRHRGGLRVLGIGGAQGSGKSTLAHFLCERLAAQHGVQALSLSLDDFYLGRAARAALAKSVHPLLATRGVPGTHDAARGMDCLHRLKTGQACALPRFSKAADDLLAEGRVIEQPPGLVIFEGWCVGVPPQPDAALAGPVNALERDEDADGRWRRHVNEQLSGPYAQWFAMLDALVFLQVPGWASVREWRAQQERETASRSAGRAPLLDAAALERFLQHYERLTLHALAAMPDRADQVLRLDEAHEVTWTLRSPPPARR